jgi:Mn-dependent DtxR family transcriptional regulator
MLSKNIIKQQQYIGDGNLTPVENKVLNEIYKLKTNGRYITFGEISGRLGKVMRIRRKDSKKFLKELHKKGCIKVVWNMGVKIV